MNKIYLPFFVLPAFVNIKSVLLLIYFSEFKIFICVII